MCRSRLTAKDILVPGQRKKEAQDKAKQIFAGVEMEKRVPLTVGKAFDNYISEKEGTLSPSTVRGYKAVRRNYLQSLMNINISDLMQNAASVLLCHNHPGGTLHASTEDIESAELIIKAGKMLGIRVLNHFIVSSEDYVSLREERGDLFS